MTQTANPTEVSGSENDVDLWPDDVLEPEFLRRMLAYRKTETKHLPGQHDQLSHGRRYGAPKLLTAAGIKSRIIKWVAPDGYRYPQEVSFPDEPIDHGSRVSPLTGEKTEDSLLGPWVAALEREAERAWTRVREDRAKVHDRDFLSAAGDHEVMTHLAVSHFGDEDPSTLESDDERTPLPWGETIEFDERVMPDDPWIEFATDPVGRATRIKKKFIEALPDHVDPAEAWDLMHNWGGSSVNMKSLRLQAAAREVWNLDGAYVFDGRGKHGLAHEGWVEPEEADETAKAVVRTMASLTQGLFEPDDRIMAWRGVKGQRGRIEAGIPDRTKPLESWAFSPDSAEFFSLVEGPHGAEFGKDSVLVRTVLHPDQIIGLYLLGFPPGLSEDEVIVKGESIVPDKVYTYEDWLKGQIYYKDHDEVELKHLPGQHPQSSHGNWAVPSFGGLRSREKNALEALFSAPDTRLTKRQVNEATEGIGSFEGRDPGGWTDIALRDLKRMGLAESTKKGFMLTDEGRSMMEDRKPRPTNAVNALYEALKESGGRYYGEIDLYEISRPPIVPLPSIDMAGSPEEGNAHHVMLDFSNAEPGTIITGTQLVEEYDEIYAGQRYVDADKIDPMLREWNPEPSAGGPAVAIFQDKWGTSIGDGHHRLTAALLKAHEDDDWSMLDSLRVEVRYGPGVTPIETKHLPGQHDQLSHGRRGVNLVSRLGNVPIIEIDVADQSTTRAFGILVRRGEVTEATETFVSGSVGDPLFELVSFLTVDDERNTGELAWTNEDYRRHGLMSRLYEAAESVVGPLEPGHERSPSGEAFEAARLGKEPPPAEQELSPREAESFTSRFLLGIGSGAGFFDLDRLKDVVVEDLYPETKHLPGEHNQMTHGNRARAVDLYNKAILEYVEAFGFTVDREEDLDPDELSHNQTDLIPESVEALRGEPQREPIQVVDDGSRLWVFDGNHRAEAARKDGRKIRAEIMEAPDLYEGVELDEEPAVLQLDSSDWKKQGQRLRIGRYPKLSDDAHGFFTDILAGLYDEDDEESDHMDRGQAAIEEAFAGTLLLDDGTEVTVKPSFEAADNDGFEFSVTFKDEHGNRLGEADRRVSGTESATEGVTWEIRDAAEVVASHEGFNLIGSVQGQGLGTWFQEASENFYRQLGVGAIVTYANVSVGGYAWARMGFDFTDASEGKVLAQKMFHLYQLQFRNTYEEDPDGLERHLGIEVDREGFDPGDYIEHDDDYQRLEDLTFFGTPTPMDLAMVETHLDEGPYWFGKEFMMDEAWYAAKVL